MSVRGKKGRRLAEVNAKIDRLLARIEDRLSMSEGELDSLLQEFDLEKNEAQVRERLYSSGWMSYPSSEDGQESWRKDNVESEITLNYVGIGFKPKHPGVR